MGNITDMIFNYPQLHLKMKAVSF